MDNNKKFNAINYPYGYCLNPSDFLHRNAYPSSDVFGNGNNGSCVTNTGLAPGLYSPPTLQDIGDKNTKSVNLLDTYFFNSNLTKPLGASNFNNGNINTYSVPSLQSVRPPETTKNSYIRLAGETLHVQPDNVLAIFFSDSNIDHLRAVIVKKVKEITSDSGIAGSKEGVTILTPNMDDFFNYMITTYDNYKIHNGSICFVNLLNNSSIQNEISKLNSSILQDYISKMVSQINMYIYYYKDASQIPEQLSVPTYVGMKGSKSLEYNVGFGSGNSTGVASYNLVGNVL